MILTGKRRLRPYIWPKNPQENKNTENIMRRTWITKLIQRQKASKKLKYLLAFWNKEIKHMRALLF